MAVPRALRLGGALALLVSGLVHLDLYFGGYRSAGSEPSFGRAILLNAVVSSVLAVAVAARREWFVRLAGIVWAAGTLAAFSYTHTEHTLFGFSGSGLEPSPEAEIVLIASIAAILLLAATFVPSFAAADRSWGMGFLGAAAGVAAVAMVGFGIYWASDDGGQLVEAGAPATVTIADFAFTPESLTVPAGTTVTWTNADGVGHSILGVGQSFTSETLDSGAAFSFTFESPGEYRYVCGLHPSMQGVVIVTE